MNVIRADRETEDYVIALRHEFHMHPEVSFQEARTGARIAEELARWGIPCETVGRGNIVGILDTGRPGKKLAIRADIDALPMQELDTTLPYCSTVPGVMHSCGHDGHTAMLLGAARVLSQQREALCGVLYFCFQVAEEVGGGADEIVAWLKARGGVDCAIGTHLDGGSEAGTLYLPDGALMAGAMVYDIEVHGVGGHGSRPDKAVDPIKPACDIALRIAQIPAQYHNPFDTCVVSTCQLHAGSANNIIPESAHIGGNVRFFKYGDDKRIEERIRMIAEHTAAAYGTTAELRVHPGSSMPVINDPAMAEIGREAAQAVGLTLAPPHDPTCGSDNYADFLCAFPGFYCDSGARCTREGASGNHHNPRFDLEERAFLPVVEFFATFAAFFLKKA